MSTATAPTKATVSTTQVLCASNAVFTLEGRGRSWTFRIEEGAASNGRPPIYFVQVLTGPDNNNDFTYVGIYEPHNGWVRLSRASKFAEDSEIVRAIRWYVGLVFNEHEDQVEAAGFHIHWSCNCARCGRTLTVASSIDNRLGPECVKLVASGR